VREISKHIKGFVVPELNYGQMAREVERCARDNCQVVVVPHAGGKMHDPKDILEAILMVAKGKPPKGD
jgi:2-oxoglutarate ferredoxin oxidoreductase subunit alpha